MSEIDKESTVGREQVQRAIEVFIESELGRPGGIYSKFGININDSTTAQIVIDLISEKIDSAPLVDLSKMVDFLSDFDKSVGGTLDGLFIRQPKFIALRTKLAVRLLTEQETGFAFDRLWGRVVEMGCTEGYEIKKMEDKAEKLKIMRDKLRKILG